MTCDTLLRTCYAVCGTDRRYSGTRREVWRAPFLYSARQYADPFCFHGTTGRNQTLSLRACYGMCGTEVGYDAMGCAVLRQGMMLCDVRYCGSVSAYALAMGCAMTAPTTSQNLLRVLRGMQ
eukprot:3740241-Rhodomonas_salina.1